MPSTKSTKSPAKAAPKAKEKGKAKEKSPAKASKPVEPVVEEDKDEEERDEDGEDDDSDSDSENGGVDEEGMERLMNALGEDGLNDFDQAMLADEDEEDESEEDDEEGVEDDEEEDENVGELSDESASENDDDDDDEQEEELVALDDEEVELEPDAVPQQKLEVDNEAALLRIRENIQLDPTIPWTETLVLSYPEKVDVDVNDDLNRELAFYKQALHGANEARKLAAKHKFPFTRPSDYFAEMVKSDAHMERIRQRLLDESAGIKKSEEKRREREGKKFGKQVQIEKLKEREKSKKDMEERLKGLKRKRKDILENGGDQGDDFDVAVEDAIADRPAKRSRGGAAGGKQVSRQARDKKFGFGGQNRRSKQNTKESTDNFDMGGSRRGGRGGGRGGRGGRGGGRGGRGGQVGGSKRPGKSRRMSARSK
ncbi:rRNA-processing protein EBP2 [Marasmius crinis-equi]|uniref:rRNA-processing protein EBP2 n=1 Tax=Marasmius crinis-equi TaxID=585013 RepID=A0ABR3FJZ4_9AGAR